MQRFKPQRFNSFLAGAVRRDVIWRRARACPCVSPHSGAADRACTFCGGIGTAWADGVPAWCGMTGLSPSKATAMFGVWEPGDALITIPSDSPLYGAGRHDRIRMVEATSPFSEVVNPEMNPRLSGTIVSIERVYWIAGGVEVEGGTPEVASTGLISWPAGETPPPEGVSFTVIGRRYDEVFVFRDLPSNRNAGVAGGLPRKLPVRNYDLFGRSTGVEPA